MCAGCLPARFQASHATAHASTRRLRTSRHHPLSGVAGAGAGVLASRFVFPRCTPPLHRGANGTLGVTKSGPPQQSPSLDIKPAVRNAPVLGGGALPGTGGGLSSCPEPNSRAICASAQRARHRIGCEGAAALAPTVCVCVCHCACHDVSASASAFVQLTRSMCRAVHAPTPHMTAGQRPCMCTCRQMAAQLL